MSNPSAGPPSQYEFGPEQNVLIGDLASKMTFVGLFGLAIGILMVLPAIFRFDPATVVMGIISILIALWTRSAGGSFREVVQTEGADVSHLMNALNSLRKLYTLTFWLCIVTVALLVIVLTVGLIGERPGAPEPPPAAVGPA